MLAPLSETFVMVGTVDVGFRYPAAGRSCPTTVMPSTICVGTDESMDGHTFREMITQVAVRPRVGPPTHVPINLHSESK